MKPQSTQKEKRRPRLPAAMALKKPKVPSSDVLDEELGAGGAQADGDAAHPLPDVEGLLLLHAEPALLEALAHQVELGVTLVAEVAGHLVAAREGGDRQGRLRRRRTAPRPASTASGHRLLIVPPLDDSESNARPGRPGQPRAAPGARAGARRRAVPAAAQASARLAVHRHPRGARLQRLQQGRRAVQRPPAHDQQVHRAAAAAQQLLARRRPPAGRRGAPSASPPTGSRATAAVPAVAISSSSSSPSTPSRRAPRPGWTAGRARRRRGCRCPGPRARRRRAARPAAAVAP